MASRPLSTNLPADLPENWQNGQIVAPSGVAAGLTEKHGYNYQSKQINDAQDAINTMNAAFDNLQANIAERVVSLTVAGWSDNLQTVSVTGVTASSKVIVSPAPASIAAYAEAGVYCSAQGSGTLTFTCESAPSEALSVVVLIA